MKSSILTLLLCSALATAQSPDPRSPRSGDRARGKSDSPAEIVLHWNEAILLSIKAEKTPPPLAARQLAILHTSIYDSVNSVRRKYQSFEVDMKAEAGTSEAAAAAGAAHRVLSNLYPKRAKTFDTILERDLAALEENNGLRNGLTLGRYVAKEIMAWRAEDGSKNEVKHKSSTKPGDWNPTPPDFTEPLVPQWPHVSCFALRRGFQFRSDGPPALTDKAYTAAFEEVKKVGAKNSTTRTRDQSEVALFWEDGVGTVTPPGHWNRIAQRVARDEGYGLLENAKLFALLNIAMADVSIACWDCKYHFNFWRPIQGIREADRDGNADTAPDRDWEPMLVSPPFPSYTSGHSSFSGAAATILAGVVGKDDYRFEVTSEGVPGATRRFTSFWAAAEEAGMSRIYGGIHWQFDNTDGLAGGKLVAKLVLAECLRPAQR